MIIFKLLLESLMFAFLSFFQYQTAISIGFLLGVIFVMANQMLIIFAIYVEASRDPSNSGVQKSSQEAMAVFAWFLFMIYAAFGIMLATFRNDVIKEGLSFIAITAVI